jgi:hypothetical protein
VGDIIDLARSDSEGEHALVEEELDGVEEEDLEEHKMVEESTESIRCKEEDVHRTVEDSFESLCKDRLHAWPRAKNQGMKAAIYP